VGVVGMVGLGERARWRGEKCDPGLEIADLEGWVRFGEVLGFSETSLALLLSSFTLKLAIIE
jgi:hypothetical protein